MYTTMYYEKCTLNDLFRE